MRTTSILALALSLSLVGCATGKGEESAAEGDVDTTDGGGVGEDGASDGTDGTDGTDGADGTDGTDGGDGTDGTDGGDGGDGGDSGSDDGGDDGTVPDEPVECDLTGHGYRLDLAGATWIEPAGVGGLLGSFLEDDLMVGVVAASGTTLNLEMALSDGAGGPQNYCLPTIPFPPADFSGDPAFAVGPADTTIAVAGTEVTIRNLELTGWFSRDCSDINDSHLEGQIDVRDLSSLLEGITGSSDPGVACSTLAAFGASCTTCVADGEPYCLDMELEDLGGVEDGESSVECVPDSDCHAMCADGDGSECSC